MFRGPLGLSGALGDSGWDYDAYAIYYAYPSSDEVDGYPELILALGRDGLVASLAYAWDNYGLGETAVYLKLAKEQELPAGFALHASLGYSHFSSPETDFHLGAPDDYFDWNLAVSRPLAGFDLRLDYFDTDGNGNALFGRELADRRLVFSIARTFRLLE
ncbi:TorF family putative porin [Wenzhouxiangella marina]|uniref:Uncharacterized protein n=1 Tax=Wenzhouxiangella marina TaxID=1579979 RepID=A0A0K0XU92_9GAMM|nr:TorF family putative porin [Wenzhouxiangella marina]AKS41279.1 hypothetical protein WM2015_898 [Wenzhouxiangella marina]MBB6086971.1 uncharacterized protein (TIGR02001 family) [Wenzhouxiangella marina]